MGEQTGPADQGGVRSGDGLLEGIQELEADLFRRIEEHHSFLRWRNPNPELVRVWGRIKDDLGEIRRLVEQDQSPSLPDARMRLRSLLGVRPTGSRTWNLQFAREFGSSLRAMLPLFGDDAYLLTQLQSRKIGRRFKRVYGKDRRETWIEKGRLDEAETARLAAELAVMQLARANKRRKEYARHAIRSRELWRIVIILLPLVVGTAYALPSALDVSGWRVGIATASGALGSVLSGVFKLAKLRRLTDLRSFQAGLLLQPVVGAAAGLFAFLLVQVGVLHLPPADRDPSVATFALYGFLAGFSEPFFFRLVERLAGESRVEAASDHKEPSGETASDEA